MKPEKQISKELRRIQTEFEKEIVKLNSRVSYRFKENTKEGMKPVQAFDDALDKTAYEKTIVDLVTESDIKGISTRYFIKNVEKIKEWVVQKEWPPERITFSETIHNNTKLLKAEIKETIKLNEAWEKTGRRIVKTKTIEADIPKYLKELIRAARQAKLDKTPGAIRKYQTKLKEAMGNIKKLAANDAPTKSLKKAYQNLLSKVIEAKEENIQKAIGRAVRNKSKYYADRVARTELIRINSATRQVDLDRDEQVVGWKSNLNSRHKIVDECDFHATADLYGMGPGVHPKNIMIQIPWHTMCFCTITFVYKAKKDKGTFSRQGGARWLRNNPSKAQGMMTIDNYKKFLKNPNDWPDLIQGWDKMYVVPRIPKRYLGDRK